MSQYLEATIDVYKDAALNPNVGLCCTTTPVWQLPELNIPSKMLAMNYGCGSTVEPRDLSNHPKVLYVGIGGGMELLQFAYFSRSEAKEARWIYQWQMKQWMLQLKIVCSIFLKQKI